jgi:hypothetical protein
VEVVSYEPEFLRPGLPIPLYPAEGLPWLVRRHVLGLRSPTFAHAYRVTVRWAATECILAITSLALPPPWQRVVVVVSAVLGLYLVLRALVLAVFEQRQRSYEPQWIAAQTELLRHHAFDVVRFTVQDLSGVRGLRRGYDLSRPADILDLLRRQDHERAAQQLSRATAEFSYLAERGIFAIAEVRRSLAELTFVPGWPGSGRAYIRFPQAYYAARLGRHPAQRTYWTLSGDVMIAAGGPTYDPGSAEVSGLGSAR